MSELFRNVTIAYKGDDGTRETLYARVGEAQYELLINRDSLAAPARNVVTSVVAQLTPTGEVGRYTIRLGWVTDVHLWDPPAGSGIARAWPNP